MDVSACPCHSAERSQDTLGEVEGDSWPDTAHVLFVIKPYLSTRVHTGCTRGAHGHKFPICDKGKHILPEAATCHPPAKLPPGEGSSPIPAARISSLLSSQRACGKVLDGLSCSSVTRHKEEGVLHRTSWSSCISAGSELPCFLALHKSLTTIALLPHAGNLLPGWMGREPQ